MKERKEQELKQVRDEFERKANDIEKKYRILDAFGDELAEYDPPFIHHHHRDLYGVSGAIHFSPVHYETLRNGKDPDRKLLSNLLKQFPPQRKVKISDGSGTSFRPEEWEFEQNPDRPGNQIYECYELHVCIDPDRYGTATVHWFAEVIGSELWEFQISNNLNSSNFGKLDLRRGEPNGRLLEETRIVVCEFRPHFNAQRIKWATGDYQGRTPNRFTLFWDKMSGEAVDFPSLLFYREGKL